MKTVQQLADTASTDVRGSSATKYALEPTQWLKTIVDAAKKKRFFESAARVFDLPEGTKDLVQPYRSKYLASVTDTTSENTEIAGTTMDNLDGVTFTPTPHRYAINISNYALRINAVNLIAAAQEELAEYTANVVDSAIATALKDATDATSSAAGAQTIYGGDATSTSTLEAGDVLTTDMIADARKRLMSTVCKYWSGGSEGTSSATKNPWYPEPDAPFLLFIGPEQENTLLKDSQFVNAAEYGSQEVVLNGEIGKYLGIKVISTVNTPSATNWGSGSNLAGHICLLVKAKYCVGVAYGQRPTLNIVDWKIKDQKRIQLTMAYDVQTIHNDAIVKIYVVDE